MSRIRLGIARVSTLLSAIALWSWVATKGAVTLIGATTVVDDFSLLQERMPLWALWLFNTPWWVPAGLATTLTAFLLWLSWPRAVAPQIHTASFVAAPPRLAPTPAPPPSAPPPPSIKASPPPPPPQIAPVPQDPVANSVAPPVAKQKHYSRADYDEIAQAFKELYSEVLVAEEVAKFGSGIMNSMEGIIAHEGRDAFHQRLDDLRLKMIDPLTNVRKIATRYKLYEEQFGDLVRMEFQDPFWAHYNLLIQAVRLLPPNIEREAVSVFLEARKSNFVRTLEDFRQWVAKTKSGLLDRRNALTSSSD